MYDKEVRHTWDRGVYPSENQGRGEMLLYSRNRAEVLQHPLCLPLQTLTRNTGIDCRSLGLRCEWFSVSVAKRRSEFINVYEPSAFPELQLRCDDRYFVTGHREGRGGNGGLLFYGERDKGLSMACVR